MPGAPRRLSQFRRTAIAATAATLAVGATFAWTGAASGQDAFSPGLGTAIAQGYKVDPRLGQLSFGITYGLSLAGHQNTVAQADSRVVDLGVIGKTMAGQACDGGDPTWPEEDQPHPLRVSTGDEGAEEGKTEDESGIGTKQAKASAAPLAEAVTTTAPVSVPGLIEFGASRSVASSGVVADGVREARAVTELSSLTLGGGAVKLTGLRWEAVHRSGGEETTKAVFSMSSMTTDGEVQEAPKDPIEALTQANAILEPLGFRIQAPVAREAQGVVFLDPMRISMIPSELRGSIVGPVMSGIQPLREALTEALIAADCGNATYITIADIALGAPTGTGSLNLDFGGAQATSSDIAFSNRLGGLGGLGSLGPVNDLSPVDGGGSTLGDTGATADLDPGAAGGDAAEAAGGEEAATGGTETAQPISNSALEGARGGALAGVGLAGLLLVAAMAEIDRRKMRQAQRHIPTEL